MEAAAKDYDLWGCVIRTTNLPNNASDFPYILEGIPNEMYEMPFYLSDFQDFKTPKEVAESGWFTKSGLDIALARVKMALNMILKVDYRTGEMTRAEDAAIVQRLPQRAWLTISPEGSD